MAKRAVIHLLDSAQGHPLKTWTFEDRDTITIGRAEDNDVVVADPYVSRTHAYLHWVNDKWQLVSISRNQVVFQGESWKELPIVEGTSFRLGPHGCFLRFGESESSSSNLRTITFEPTLIPVFNLDRDKMQSEVAEITGGSYFQKLKEAAKLLREQRHLDDTKG